MLTFLWLLIGLWSKAESVSLSSLQTCLCGKYFFIDKLLCGLSSTTILSYWWHGNETDLDQVPSLWRNKAVELNIATPGELVMIHLIALPVPQLQAVKDRVQLLLSPTIDNRLLSVINQLGSSTCYRYTICDSKSILHSTAPRPCVMKTFRQHYGHRPGTAPRPRLYEHSSTADPAFAQAWGRELRAGPIGSSCSDLDLIRDYNLIYTGKLLFHQYLLLGTVTT